MIKILQQQPRDVSSRYLLHISKQDDGRTAGLAIEEQVGEVRVLGDDHETLAVSEVHDLFVGRALETEIPDIANDMACLIEV